MERAFVEAVRPSWHEFAACRGRPTEWWFPTRTESTWKAKIVCSSCRVAERCLDQALDGDEVGIWAGLATGSRRRLTQDAA